MTNLDEHVVKTSVTKTPGGVRVRTTCTCGSFSFDPWPQAADLIVDFQASHLDIPHEQGRAKLRERLEHEVKLATCGHDTIAEAGGLGVCMDCGEPNPKRSRRHG